MNAELCWDGLRMDIPHAMEPAVLDRGFIRLAGPGQPAIDLRFGMERGQFDPKRDGLRILKASGLEHEILEPAHEPWNRELKGDLYSCGRLHVLRFRETRCVVAALFSTPPPPGMVRGMMASLAWTSPENWRTWRCYDLEFETPPHFTLTKAVFRPGRFHLGFARGRSGVSLDRLAPANVLLADATLDSWVGRFAQREHGCELAVALLDEEHAEFSRRPGMMRTILPWLPGIAPHIRGLVRHDALHNKILVLTERGRPSPQPIFERMYSSYATTTIQN